MPPITPSRPKDVPCDVPRKPPDVPRKLPYRRSSVEGGVTISPDQTLYERLGVSSVDTIEEIKRAWRRAAFDLHPDRGGDPASFRLALDAWETLSDPVRRWVYDHGPRRPHRQRPACMLARWFEDHGARQLREDEVLTWARTEAPELLPDVSRALWASPKLTRHHRLRTSRWGYERWMRLWWVESTAEPPR